MGNFDCVACGGVHVKHTGNVELVKATAVEKIRGNCRITWKIGDRAYADYHKKDQIISQLKPVLATNEDQYVQKAISLNEDIITYKRKCNHLEIRLAETMAEDLYNRRQPIPNTPTSLILQTFKNEDDTLVKKVLKNLLKRENLIICLLNDSDEKVQWSIACTESTTFPFNENKTDLLAPISGKGGGRHPLWQGTGSNPSGIDQFMENIKGIVN